jgi:hypothetical protein
MLEQIRTVLIKLAELEAAVDRVQGSCYGDDDILKAIKQAKADYILSFNSVARNIGYEAWNDRFYDPNVFVAKLYF